MEKDKILNLTFASSLTDLCEINSSFDHGVLRVAYTGKNQNHSSISKDVFEKCIPSMYNCPIVCNYDRDTETLGGHDMEVIRNSEGALQIINVTNPIGVIPESAKYWWEYVEEEDGTENEYLFVEALIWKRQEAYRKLKDDGITSQSMEIKIKDAAMEDGYLNIADFEFTAFCLIGVEPCYESSALVFSKGDIKDQLSEMMQDLKDTLTQANTSEDDCNIHPQKYSMEGGEKALDEKMKLVADYGIDVESLDFSLEDFTIEELTEKFEAMKAASDIDESEPAGDPVEDTVDDIQTFALTGQMVDEICRQLATEQIETAWGQESKYWYIDCDFEANEVYAHDISDWLVYGFTYTVDGDSVKVDFDSKKRKKFAIVDFDEGEQSFPAATVFEHAAQAIKDGENWKEKFDKASEQITAMETELNELRQFRADVEAADAEAKRIEVFAMFEDLTGIEAFETLRENCSEMDADVLRKECFAIRGEFGVQAKFSAEPAKSPKLKVVKSDISKEPYGGAVEEYAGKE